MTTAHLIIEQDPDEKSFAEISGLAPANPFLTAAYARVRRAQGATPWILAVHEENSPPAACVAFMTTGRLHRRLEIPSIPALPDEHVFWKELLAMCTRQHVTHLELNSFCSPSCNVPRLGKEATRRPRTEFVLDLQRDPLWGEMSSNHLRNVRRARKQGVRVQQTDSPSALAAHAALMSSSLERRQDRGENVSSSVEIERLRSYMDQGAAELHQAYIREDAVSSILILTAPSACYYHSAGTSHEGMNAGASQLLICSVAEALRARGCTSFNLGGAGADQAGLVRFKLGFGSRPVQQEAAAFNLTRKAGAIIGATARLLRIPI